MKKIFLVLFLIGMFFSNMPVLGFVPSTGAEVSNMVDNSTDAMVDNLSDAAKEQYMANWLELQRRFESEVDEMIRIQDDFERSMVLGAQNLSTKKNLTKKEKKRLMQTYRKMPKTVEEYKEMSRDIKREQRKVAPAKIIQDEKLVKVPEPRYQIVKYNLPPGVQNIDLRNLVRERQVTSIGVISPKQDKLAFTSVYYAGYNDKVSSEVFYIDLDTSKPIKQRVKTASLMNKKQVKLIDAGVKEEYPTLFRTLTIVDWSQDGTKLAVKERVGSSTFGIWQTNLWVCDLSDNTTKQLVEVRDAVKYWWKENKNINIDDYRWDIVPIGWDEVNSQRIVVCAYAYTNKKNAMFLGIFSVDANGQNSQLISSSPMSLNISTNGLVLKPIFE